MTKQVKFILAIVLQVIIIFGIIIFKLSVFTSGTEIWLKIIPVDPRDLLRGDYITFQYSISDLDSYYFGGEQVRNGDTVYVVLRKVEKYWVAQNVQKNKPTGNELFIKGKVERGGLGDQLDPFSSQNFISSRIHIAYGIEQYFIPEGKGLDFNFWDREVAAVVAVDDDGNATLKKIYIDDKPWP
jgi:uncharacterized membrane-anchored protein